MNSCTRSRSSSSSSSVGGTKPLGCFDANVRDAGICMRGFLIDPRDLEVLRKRNGRRDAAAIVKKRYLWRVNLQTERNKKSEGEVEGKLDEQAEKNEVSRRVAMSIHKCGGRCQPRLNTAIVAVVSPQLQFRGHIRSYSSPRPLSSSIFPPSAIVPTWLFS